MNCLQVNLPLFAPFLRQTFASVRATLLGNNISSQYRPGGIKIPATIPVEVADFPSQTDAAYHPDQKRHRQRSLGQKILDIFLLTLMSLSFVIAGILFIPQAYYHFFPADTKPLQPLEKGSAFGGEFKPPTSQQQIKLPPKDPDLPTGDWLIIPRIGVRTKIQTGMSAEAALKNGVWLAPGYGKAGEDNGLPIILAAHRFGWQWWWQTDYWKYNSFYNLPKLETGDLVEIISDQRKWTYEIYAGAEGEKITDYEADVILYTCKFLNSPVRYFRYARLINLDKNTQG